MSMSDGWYIEEESSVVVEPPSVGLQAADGIARLERLVRVHQSDPSGRALHEAVRQLDLGTAHGLVLLAVIGIADHA